MCNIDVRVVQHPTAGWWIMEWYDERLHIWELGVHAHYNTREAANAEALRLLTTFYHLRRHALAEFDPSVR